MRTSINISEEEYNCLERVATGYGLTFSVIIGKCLRKMIDTSPKELYCSQPLKLVSYQERGRNYRILNVTFPDDLYSLNINFRSFCRLSVSLLVSMALSMFLNNLFDSNRSLHNYEKRIWDLVYRYIPSKKEWIIKWKNREKRRE